MSDERTLDLLESKIEELRQLDSSGDGMGLAQEIARLEKRLKTLRRELYSNLTDWERVKIARHPKRPYALDYIDRIFSDFYELRGDRVAGDDRALLTGLARFHGRSVVLLAQQKGRTTEESKERNFGMARPQGYRKAKRAMMLADRFGLPVISLVDTTGAYPGLESEEQNIGGAIAECLLAMAGLRVPTVAAVIGEGGSGGALAIALADRVVMLENAIYSVITPEGAAAILWKDKDRTREAAAALQLTADALHGLGVIDEIVPEPLGGAHKDFPRTAAELDDALRRHLDELSAESLEERLSRRTDRYLSVGEYRVQQEEDA